MQTVIDGNSWLPSMPSGTNHMQTTWRGQQVVVLDKMQIRLLDQNPIQITNSGLQTVFLEWLCSRTESILAVILHLSICLHN
uniref:Uncharacterized protein n=1 Tax=Arion vulgaris TaxID=1028688 RepID=A0A0B7BDX3_9EUPU